MAIRKQKKHRGAVSKQLPKPSKPRLHWHKLMSLVWGVLAIGCLFVAYVGGERLLNHSVDKVTVTGELRHVKKNEVIAEVMPFLQEGFVRLEMDVIRAQLETLPWVFEVRLQREWPNSVVIEIVEQQAIAQWGDKGYLNHRGELFTPEQIGVQEGLPVLGGPENSTKQVMDYYRSVGNLMREQGLALESLTLDKRGSWRALLARSVEANGVANKSVEVVIGRDQVLEKMQRFIQVYNKALPKDLVAVKKVDMRYSNGVAVSWHRQS